MPLPTRHVKVLCTLGPASLDGNTIRRLAERGVDLFRINLSHTPLEKVAETVAIIQSHSSVPVCLDTEGAQARTGRMAESVSVSEAQHVRLTRESVEGTDSRITITPASVFDEIEPNHIVGLDFDGVMLLVLAKDADGADTVVINSGKIGSNKAAVITPAVPLPAISEKDRAAIEIGRRLGVRHFALSFTNSADDVHELRKLTGPDSVIISKIESKRGVLNLDEILAAADEILIDRGDLSREVPLENIPLLQKAIIRKANQVRTPVNVATNLLESMIVNRKPTRAELNDIVNTLLDGATGLVLAAETAIGSYPVGAVDMVLNLIERIRRASEGYRIEDLLEANTGLLPTLHGERSLEAWPSRRRRATQASVDRLPAVEISAETVLDVEHLVRGVYSPLRGFMTEEELNSVLDHNRLPDGNAWTMPIILQGKSQEFAAYQPGQSVRLVDSNTGRSVAILRIEDKFEIDPESVAQRWFGTSHKRHPGVRKFASGGLTLLGGPIEYLPIGAAARSPYELSPAQTRMIFDIKGWTKIVAFHVESAPHRAHEHIIERAADRARVDGILIQPAVGVKNVGDYSAPALIGAYEQLIRISFPNAVLAAFGTYARLAGPREVVFNALCRKNFGCTHFVVGSDLSPTTEYSATATRDLFDSLGDIGIAPVYFDTVYFSDEHCGTVEGKSDAEGLREITGSRVRQLLAADQSVPNWCMRGEVSKWLIDARDSGSPLFTSAE